MPYMEGVSRVQAWWLHMGQGTGESSVSILSSQIPWGCRLTGSQMPKAQYPLRATLARCQQHDDLWPGLLRERCVLRS